jgi:AcrR family transcriptional regulator
MNKRTHTIYDLLILVNGGFPGDPATVRQERLGPEIKTAICRPITCRLDGVMALRTAVKVDAELDLWPEASDPNRRLLTAALNAFAERGYHGTTTRDIAKKARMSPAAIYTHYSSKAEMLFQISRSTHMAMIQEMRAQFARSAGPVERVHNLVNSWVAFHARMHTACRVANYELGALEPKRRGLILEMRSTGQAVMREAIRLGMVSGDFHVADLEVATILLLSLGIDVARWFVPGNRLSPAEIAQQYADYAVRLLCALDDKRGAAPSS